MPNAGWRSQRAIRARLDFRATLRVGASRPAASQGTPLHPGPRAGRSRPARTGLARTAAATLPAATGRTGSRCRSPDRRPGAAASPTRRDAAPPRSPRRSSRSSLTAAHGTRLRPVSQCRIVRSQTPRNAAQAFRFRRQAWRSSRKPSGLTSQTRRRGRPAARRGRPTGRPRGRAATVPEASSAPSAIAHNVYYVK